MLGIFINRCLLMLFGYAYPAFQCYKTLEKNKRSYDIEELRFWCKYWIIVATFTVAERIGDILISWLPVYGEMKLAFLIYLWHPNTKGSGHVYGAIMQPYLVKNEAEIERMLLEMKVRAWDLAFLLWTNCSQLGHSTFLKALNCAAQFQKYDKKASMAAPSSPDDLLSSFDHQPGEKTANTSSPEPPKVVENKINRVCLVMQQTDGERSPKLEKTESFSNANEEDNPNPDTPYPRSRLRRVNAHLLASS